MFSCLTWCALVAETLFLYQSSGLSLDADQQSFEPQIRKQEISSFKIESREQLFEYGFMFSQYFLLNFDLKLTSIPLPSSYFTKFDILHIRNNEIRSTDSYSCYNERLPFVWYDAKNASIYFDVYDKFKSATSVAKKVTLNEWININVEYKKGLFTCKVNDQIVLQQLASITEDEHKLMQIPSKCNLEHRISPVKGMVKDMVVYYCLSRKDLVESIYAADNGAERFLSSFNYSSLYNIFQNSVASFIGVGSVGCIYAFYKVYNKLKTLALIVVVLGVFVIVFGFL